MMINLKKSNRVAIYAMGLSWGYAMAKAYDRKARREKRGKNTDLPKLIGMTWEEWYRLQYNLGEKIGEIVEGLISINSINHEIDDSIEKSKDLQVKPSNLIKVVQPADNKTEFYRAEDGTECVYISCEPETCERRKEFGCTACIHDNQPAECPASDDDDDSCRECPRFQRHSRGCDGCKHQELPPTEWDDEPRI